MQTLRPIDFSEFLVERRALSEAQWLDVLAEQWGGRKALPDAIIARGYVGAEELARLRREFEQLSVVLV